MDDLRASDGRKITEDGGPIGLALSGSGLRASLFHIGLIARLAELDLLRRIDMISATGGAAVIAALYHLHLKRLLDAEGDIGSDRLAQMVQEMERYFLQAVEVDFQARLFENPFANLRRVSATYSSATRLGHLLDRQVFRPVWNGKARRPVEMRDLLIRPRGDSDFNPATDNQKRYCKAPVLIINATNLTTGRPFRFDAERMGEPAAGPALRRLSKAPLLAQSSYDRLPDAFARMPLGQAIAASMAAPELVEPLHLHRLYPDPERRSKPLDIRLGDGRLADALGTDALLERGCGRLIIGDASGAETLGLGLTNRTQALQLANLEARRPGGVVLVHMLREIEAPEVRPLGKIERGRVVKDRTDGHVTSFGVQRRAQKLIAGMRTGLDAPSEIEAMSLMASGYLIARRAFQQHRQSGHAWTDDPPLSNLSWRFEAMIEPLRHPSKALLKHLRTASLSTFRVQRLALSQAFGSGFLALAAALTLIALGAIWSALRPEAGADRLWMVTTFGLLLLLAWLAGRHLQDDNPAGLGPRRPSLLLSGLDKIGALLIAFPRALAACFQRRASQFFLKAGQLTSIGIEPAARQKQSAEENDRLDLPAPEALDRAA